MARRPELAAGITCLVILLTWRLGYPLTSFASGALVVALLLIAVTLFRRRVRLTMAMRDAIFRPEARARRWFTGRLTGLFIAIFEAGAIVLAIAHFALHAGRAELVLAGAIGTATLGTLAATRLRAGAQLQPDFALMVSAWVSVGIALPASLALFWMHRQGLLPMPGYLDVVGFRAMLDASLDDLPARRDGIIEALGMMRLVEATTLYALHALRDIWGTPILYFLYNAGICVAIARFFADTGCTFISLGGANDPANTP